MHSRKLLAWQARSSSSLLLICRSSPSTSAFSYYPWGRLIEIWDMWAWRRSFVLSWAEVRRNVLNINTIGPSFEHFCLRPLSSSISTLQQELSIEGAKRLLEIHFVPSRPSFHFSRQLPVEGIPKLLGICLPGRAGLVNWTFPASAARLILYLLKGDGAQRIDCLLKAVECLRYR